MNQPKMKRRRNALSRWLDLHVLLVGTDIERRRTENDIKAFNLVYAKASKKDRDGTLNAANHGALHDFLRGWRDRMQDHAKEQIAILRKKLGIRNEGEA